MRARVFAVKPPSFFPVDRWLIRTVTHTTIIIVFEYTTAVVPVSVPGSNHYFVIVGIFLIVGML